MQWIHRRSTILAVILSASGVLAWWATSSSPGQTAFSTPANPPQQPVAGRFEFLVVESFDARYYLDTPGHLGRAASGRVVPRIALNDPVMRGPTKVGRVTHLIWNEARESLEVEFDPLPNVRVAVGDAVWIAVPVDKAL